MKCHDCGADTFIDEHTPCGDHPELITARHECAKCDWRSDEWTINKSLTEREIQMSDNAPKDIWIYADDCSIVEECGGLIAQVAPEKQEGFAHYILKSTADDDKSSLVKLNNELMSLAEELEHKLEKTNRELSKLRVVRASLNAQKEENEGLGKYIIQVKEERNKLIEQREEILQPIVDLMVKHEEIEAFYCGEREHVMYEVEPLDTDEYEKAIKETLKRSEK